MRMSFSILTSLVWLSTQGCSSREDQCGDAIDNDSDGWTDCFDQDCAATCGEICGNLIDDNDDGTVDCNDPLCAETCTERSATPEDCANAVDDDNDWLVDCQDDDCASMCDGDGDGWLGTGGPDCDDGDAAVHPAAAEVPYDAVDNDCDPATPDDDVDGDGFLRSNDCDDEDADTYPDAPEVCGDAVLNDCTSPAVPQRDDCFGDRLASSADATLYGAVQAGLAGYSVAMAGDVDQDGYDDLIIGSYGDGDDNTGATYLVYGPVAGEFDLASAGHKWLGENGDSWAGFFVAGGSDLTGDGHNDVAIGVPYDDQGGNNAGAVLVVEADAVGEVTELADESRKVVGALQYDYAGSSVAMPGDLDGDGFADLLVGSPNNTTFFASAGIAQIVWGPITGPVQLSLVDFELLGEAKDDYAGCAVGSAGDLDGDGLNDILVGVCLNDRGGNEAGAAVQFSQVSPGMWRIDNADGAIIGEGANDHLGQALAGGDVNADGKSDVVIGSPLNDANGEDSGAAYLSTGPATVSMNNPDAKLVGDVAGDKAGTSVAVIGDLDGDGFQEIAIGAPFSDLGAEDGGAAYILFGRANWSGEIGLDEADVRIIGSAAFDFVGQSLAGNGDVNQDGWPDLFVGAPYNDTQGAAAGAAHLFTFDW